jgi:hypothetical protein
MVLCMLVLLYLHVLFKPVLGPGTLSGGDRGPQVPYLDGLVHVGSFVLACAIQPCPGAWHPVEGRPGVTGTVHRWSCVRPPHRDTTE